MATLTIPNTSLPDGDSVFGPVTAASTISQIEITIDRTVASGMNSKTSATTLMFYLEFSTDGGVTFPFVGQDGPIPGGDIIDQDTGLPIDTSSFGNSLPPQDGSTLRQARTRITVAGGPVNVAGTLVTS